MILQYCRIDIECSGVWRPHALSMHMNTVEGPHDETVLGLLEADKLHCQWARFDSPHWKSMQFAPIPPKKVDC